MDLAVIDSPMDTPAAKSRKTPERFCDACETQQPCGGFRDGMCAKCFKTKLRDVPHERLVDAMHAAYGGSDGDGSGMSRKRRDRLRRELFG